MSVKVACQNRKHCHAGEVIFRQGDLGLTMIYIVSGSVHVIKDDVIIAQRGQGEFLGEMSLIENYQRSATVVAAEECEIEECNQQMFLQIVRQDPAFAIEVMKNLSHRLRESDSLRIKELEDNNQNLEEKNQEFSRINRFLEQLIEQSPAGIMIADKDGVVKNTNPAARRILNLESVKPPILLKTYFTACKPVENLIRSQRQSWVGECKTGSADNNQTLYLSISQLYFGNPESEFLLIFEDITELIELNQQIIKLERFATEAEITSGIAHSIKNYLAVLSGNFELIQIKLEGQSREKLQPHIQSIEQGFREIESFVENMMGGRVESGAFSMKSLEEMVRVMVKFLAPQKRFRNIDIRAQIDPAFPRFLYINESQIQQVLLNLLINAADALNEAEGVRKKEIRIELAFNRAARPQLIIADSGPGIPLEHQADVFAKRFTTKTKGHGIGLITVKKIIDQHHGEITVQSKAGEGTEFIITFKSDG